MGNKSILFVSARSDLGGGPKNMYRLVAELVRMDNFEVVVACPNDGVWYNEYSKLSKQRNIILYDLPLRKIRVRNIVFLRKIIYKHNVKYVCSHGKGAGLWSRLLRIINMDISVIHYFRGIHINNMRGLAKHVYIRLERIMKVLTSIHICVSEAEKKQAIQLRFVEPKRTYVINNSIDTTIFHKPTESKKKKLKMKFNNSMCLRHTGPTLSVVARFSYQKNIGLTLDVVEKYKSHYENISVLLVGGEDDYTTNEVKEWIRERKLENNVLMVGPQNDVRPFYWASDIFLTTSRWEGLPTTVLEAQACGVPAICSNVVGNDCAILNGVSGFLVNEKEVDGYVRYIRMLWENKNMLKTMGNEGEKFVSTNFRQEKTTQEFIDVITCVKRGEKFWKQR